MLERTVRRAGAGRAPQISDSVAGARAPSYTSLLRLQQQCWITAEWGTSKNNRRARFYAITARGRTPLEAETETWERISSVIRRVLRLQPERES